MSDVEPPIDSHNEEWQMDIYPHINTQITCQEMLKNLCPAYKPSQGFAPPPPEMKNTENGNSTYCDYLNRLSSLFQTDSMPYTIQFRSQGATSQPPHPTRTISLPEIMVIRQYSASKSPIDSHKIHWSHLEATGAEESDEEREAQAGAYTAYHLQARPDLVSAVGICVGVARFKLFFSNACRVYHSPDTEWNTTIGRQLLYAWMWRLYNPELDASITIDMMTSPIPTFTVTTNDQEKHGLLSVFRTGESIGRRTIVLAREPPPSEPTRTMLRSHSNAPDSIVIKEQYIEAGHRFTEGPILEKIHQNGRFPGIVRLDHFEYVEGVSVEHKTKNKDDTVTRVKTRLVLKDQGVRLADVKTPREFLMGIYDLLEISRILYRKCGILHCDISPGNVLVGDKPSVSAEYLRGDLGDMCFSEYLLDTSAGQDDSESDDPQRRFSTRVMLIDFESAEDQDPSDPSPSDRKARKGTPAFMARMVRSSMYPEGYADLPPMPEVDSSILSLYRCMFETRLEDFPENEEESIKIPKKAAMDSEKFQHLLRYDAESVFWYLLWWCIQAQPAGKLAETEDIEHRIWSDLTDVCDGRHNNFVANFPYTCLHSSYGQLVALLDDMRTHLAGDLDFSRKEKGREHPEYMHEVFQRTILNFLFANKNERFMDLKKADDPRSVKLAGMRRTGTTQPSKRMLDDAEDQSTRKRKKQRTRK